MGALARMGIKKGEAYKPDAKLKAMFAAMVVLAAHIPVMVIEGVFTSACVGFLRKVKPEMLDIRQLTADASTGPAQTAR